MTWTSKSYVPLTVPVLELDGHVLLPAASTPYRVSDARQRALVSELVERPLDQRWVGVPARAGELDDALGTLGLITVATPLAGGEFIIVVEGRSACRLEPVPESDKSYRHARARNTPDRPEPLAISRRETTRMIQSLFSLYDAFLLAATDLPVSDHGGVDDVGLVYRIASAVLEEPKARVELLAERCPARRRALVMTVIADQLAFAQREGLLGRAAVAC